MFPLQSLKVAKLTFYSVLERKTQTSKVPKHRQNKTETNKPHNTPAKTAGVGDAGGRGSRDVRLSCRDGKVWWQVPAEAQRLGCSFLQEDVGQRKTSRHFSGQVSVYLFCCHICLLYLLSLNCFSLQARTMLCKDRSNNYNQKRQHSHC